jgi:hypothetical protein
MSSQDSISPPATRQNEAHHAAENPEHTGSAAQGRKKRVRNWTADDRAAHRVFERSRREAFKGRLTVSHQSQFLHIQHQGAVYYEIHVVLTDLSCRPWPI